jgi:hypothetical protein
MTAMSGATPQRVTLTIAVDVDPVAHGHDLTSADAQYIVRRAINDRRGLEVVESFSVVTP